jgi:uncharacterized delta-60 repeat protein
MSIVKTSIKAFGLAVLVANSGWALPTLDPTFGTHGVATAEFSEPFSSLSETHAIGVLPDGRILVAGSGNFIPTAASASEWTVIFARLLTQGQRDESFGPGGIKHVPLAGFAAAAGVTPESIAIKRGIFLPGGRVLLAGSISSDWRLPSVPMVGRFTTEGELDPSFAGQGLALLNLDWPSGWAQPAVTGFAMQSDGGIVLLVRGTLQGTGRVSNSAWLLRLDSSGQLDTAFGSEGRAEITLDAPIQSDRVLVEPGSQGGIVVALGFRESLPPRQGVMVMRFDGRGSRDNGYGDGENGQITILPAADPQPVGIRGAEMQPDGRPVLLVSIPFRSDAVVVRLDPTGQPDADFGVDGSFWFQDTAGSRTGAGLRVDGDSGILFAGSLGNAGSSQTLRLSRLQPDGEPDLTYTQSPWPEFEEPGLFESRPLTELNSFSVTTLVPDASRRVLLAGNSLRQIVVGQDEFGADIVESRKGFLVARIAEEVLPVLGFSLANYSIREGDGVQIDGQRSVALTVRRQGQLDQAVTFGYRAFSRPDDTATSGEDYLAVERQATLLAGWTGMQIYVPVLLDSLPEESETFSVELFAVDPGVSIEPGRASARVTILDGRTGISVTKRVSDGSAWRMPESSVEYAVEVTNWGPLDSGELRAEADVPLPLLRLPGMSLSASQGTATYQLDGSKFVWEVGSLAAGRSARMTYQIYIPALPEPRRIESEARVEVLSGPPDNNPANNTNRTFLVVGGADLRADYAHLRAYRQHRRGGEEPGAWNRWGICGSDVGGRELQQFLSGYARGCPALGSGRWQVDLSPFQRTSGRRNTLGGSFGGSDGDALLRATQDERDLGHDHHRGDTARDRGSGRSRFGEQPNRDRQAQPSPRRFRAVRGVVCRMGELCDRKRQPLWPG